MNDKMVFLDSNVLVYLFSKDDARKEDAAVSAISRNICFTGVNNINETITVLSKKFSLSHEDLLYVVKTIGKLTTIVSLKPEIILPTLQIKNRYGYSYYDSLVIALAIETGCVKIFTEDMQHGQIINGKLEIVDIFQESA